MIQLCTQPGSASRPNEDWCSATKGADSAVAVVLDGVTTPGDTGCHHGTPWYVQQLGTELIRHTADHARTLTQSLADSIAAVTALHASSCDISHRGTPAAAVAIARVHQHHVEYLVLADTTIAVLDNDGRLTHAVDPRVDDVTARDAADALHWPIGSAEHRDAVRRMSRNQQLQRNRHGGYWVAAADPEAADEAITGCSKNPRRLALLTDGAARAVDVFDQYSWREALDILHTSGPSELITQVRSAEQTDPHGLRWPRFKTSDDAAVAYLDIGFPV